MKSFLLSIVAIFTANCYAQDTANNDTFTAKSDTFEFASDTLKDKNGNVLKEVKVNASRQPTKVSAFRSGLKVMDTPQAVQVVDAEIMEQQQAIRLSDVIKNANGVYEGSARGGAQESFWSRGYDMTANNMFKNGFRYNGGSIPEISGLERVEFLKGGSALLFGNVAPGGILNLVTKTPKFEKGGQLTMQMGSFAYYKPSIDFYGPINNFIAYRFNASYEKSESFRDFVTNDRIYINPSFLFQLSDKTQIIAQGDYLSADWTPDFGTGIVGKEILDLPRNVFFGALWSTGNTKSASASVQFTHDFNKDWKLGFNTSYQSYKRTQKSTSQLGNLASSKVAGVENRNEVLWKRGLIQNDAAEIILGNQLSLQGCFMTGKIKHQIFTGADFEDATAPSYTFGFFGTPTSTTAITTESNTINLFKYDYSLESRNAPFFSRATTLATTNTKRFGAFAQDLISINTYIKVLAGLRWSWQEAQITTAKEVPNTITKTVATSLMDAIPTNAAKVLNRAYSPKAGIVFQPKNNTSLFASYSNSFTPNTGTTVDLKTLQPSIIDQIEVGVKKEFFKGNVITNITAYQIQNNNLAQTAQFAADGVTPNVNSDLKQLVGATKGKGIEFDITATPTEGFHIIAGYSFNETKITKSSNTVNSLVTGDILTRTPKHTANLSFFYKLPNGALKGLAFGAIANYLGDRTGGWNDRYILDTTTPDLYDLRIEDRDIPLKGYTSVDASLGYDWAKVSILCKVSNLANVLNYTVHENYSTNPIAPRQVMLSLKYKL